MVTPPDELPVATAGRTPTLIGSVRRALRVLEEVADSAEPLPAKAVARRLGLPLPTTYHLLRTLAHEGYLERLGDGRWTQGGRLERLRHSADDGGALARSRPVMREAAHGLASTLYVARWHDGEVEMAEVVDMPGCRRIDLWVGIHDAVHATALGKAILHGLDDTARREFVYSHALPDFTRRTVTDRQELLTEVTGSPVAVDREEYSPGVACIAALTQLGDAPAAIAIALDPADVDRTFDPTAATLHSYARRIQLASAAL